MKKIIEVEEEIMDTGYPDDYEVLLITDELREKFNKYTSLRLSVSGSYGYLYGVFHREETDQEYEIRLEWEKKRAIQEQERIRLLALQTEAEELQTYKRLKAKYESKGKI